MPRSPDMPCADCGELMWRSRTSAAPGSARCRACRAKARGTRPKPVTEYNCQACGTRVVRKATRGQRPKWCPNCRANGIRDAEARCAHCNDPVGWGTKFCSVLCSNRAKPPRPKAAKPAKPPYDPRSELRRGYEDGDPELFFAALVAKANTDGDCWIWPRCRDGYPQVAWAGRTLGLHRLVLEVKHGAPLGSQHAHHVCANSECVNPDHLQPVTHRDNIAEMLARQSYLTRIAELEEALSELASDHPLLDVIRVA